MFLTCGAKDLEQQLACLETAEDTEGENNKAVLRKEPSEIWDDAQPRDDHALGTPEKPMEPRAPEMSVELFDSDVEAFSDSELHTVFSHMASYLK